MIHEEIFDYTLSNHTIAIDNIKIPLDKKTLSTIEALELSIKKWEMIISLYEGRKDFKGVEYVSDGGTDTCALCFLFYIPQCNGCPVSQKTGETACEGSPYQAWSRNKNIIHAKNELEFLRTLLQEEYQKETQDVTKEQYGTATPKIDTAR